MTERKKPGPKPKCPECGRKANEGHYDDCPVGLGVNARVEGADAPVPAAAVQPEAEAGAPDAVSAAQAYAQRVWDGQSVDVPRAERLRRVKVALDGQGLSMEGVQL